MTTEREVRAIAEAEAEAGRSRGQPTPQVQPRQGPSALEAFSRSAIGRVLDNLLGAPSALGGMLAGGIVPPGPTRERITQSVSEAIPSPTADDILTSTGLAPDAGLVSSRFQEERPTATAVGGLVGDAATVLGGRAPIRAAARSAPPRLPRPKHTGARKVLDDIVDSRIGQSLKRGGIRVSEAGLEGAVMAALNDDDPVTGAALAAGQQAGSSMALRVGEEFFGGSKARFLTAVAMSAVAVQLVKETIPGGKDFILESSETAIKKVIPVAALGTLAAFAGGGRVGGSLQKNLPVLADALTTIPRGSMQSLIRDLATDRDSGDGSVLRVIQTFGENPDAFGPAVRRRLERALMDDRRSVTKEIDRLMGDRSFRRRLGAISE